EEAKKVLVSEMGGTLYTAAKDVKIQVYFNPRIVGAYRLIGYENRLLENKDFEDDTKDAGDLGAGHTVVALYELAPADSRSTALAEAKPRQRRIAEKEQSTLDLPTAGWCELRLRYKPVEGNKSSLLTFPVTTQVNELGQASTNLRWAAAVAEFGMLLRGSAHLGTATYPACRTLAESAQGLDPHGYRAEMLGLLDKAETLSEKTLGEK
ncbi:MAG: YfbK domain-containing protein, partial [Saprospiraceae bacterium]